MAKHSNKARGGFLATMGAAIHVARAVEAGRMPESRVLKALGIDEKAFRAINLR